MLNLATAQGVHVVAPAAVSVLVTEPAVQLAHATVEAALNVPAAQIVHTRLAVAPAAASASAVITETVRIL